ncbi:hypothetical protein FRC10_003555, partial [Ceratobasidium sp. 414]
MLKFLEAVVTVVVPIPAHLRPPVLVPPLASSRLAEVPNGPTGPTALVLTDMALCKSLLAMEALAGIRVLAHAH